MVITYPRGQMPFDVDVGTIAQDYGRINTAGI